MAGMVHMCTTVASSISSGTEHLRKLMVVNVPFEFYFFPWCYCGYLSSTFCTKFKRLVCVQLLHKMPEYYDVVLVIYEIYYQNMYMKRCCKFLIGNWIHFWSFVDRDDFTWSHIHGCNAGPYSFYLQEGSCSGGDWRCNHGTYAPW